VVLNDAFDREVATFTRGKLVTPPLLPSESRFKPGICCDATKDGGTKPIDQATCDCNGDPYSPPPSPHPTPTPKGPTPPPSPQKPTPPPVPIPPTPSGGGKKVPAANFLGCYQDHRQPNASVNASRFPFFTPKPGGAYCDLNATVVASEACLNEDPSAPGPLPRKDVPQMTNEV
jgi:hypothetical protein